MMSLVEKLRAAERRINPTSAEAFVVPMTAQQTAFLTDVARVLSEAAKALSKTTHCSTCQCNKLNDEASRRVPDNPRSRSWHQD